MKIVVYGAGGVGAFYGGLLARAGHDVRFVARGAQLDALRSRGLRISSLALGEISIPPVAASASAADAGRADLVLVCVKAHQTEGILDDVAACVGPDTILMAFQNGIESDDVLAARFGGERVLSAVVYVGATLEEPGFVRHVAAGTLVIGRPLKLPASGEGSAGSAGHVVSRAAPRPTRTASSNASETCLRRRGFRCASRPTSSASAGTNSRGTRASTRSPR